MTDTSTIRDLDYFFLWSPLFFLFFFSLASFFISILPPLLPSSLPSFLPHLIPSFSNFTLSSPSYLLISLSGCDHSPSFFSSSTLFSLQQFYPSFLSPLLFLSSPSPSISLHYSHIFLERIIMFRRLCGDYMFIHYNLTLGTDLHLTS